MKNTKVKLKKSGKMDFGRKLKLGIWGLGRGRAFYQSCAAVGFEIVAGCDYNPDMRKNFTAQNPQAMVTDDDRKFLDYDMDAVLLATYCPAHADDAIRCLRAGKHVLSEVTSFHTMAEGVRLVEAVEKSGLVYNLAENYPFTKTNMWLAQKYREGLFGELMYAEFEYVHNCISLGYTYLFGNPIVPGNTVHNWRSWLNLHYYNTHSLGPMMIISGQRPTRIVALPSRHSVPGVLRHGPADKGGVAASLITLAGGAVVRNLMGEMSSDTHQQRLWGTLGAAEVEGYGGNGEIKLRLGGMPTGPKMKVTVDWPAMGEIAKLTGHGGGDFWVLYYFAREIRDGIPAPFDIYTAADCTAAGILGYRSAVENGRAYDIPDFRRKSARARWRNDNFAMPRYDVRQGCFPRRADPAITRHFSKTMADMIRYSNLQRCVHDWEQAQANLCPEDREKYLALKDKLQQQSPDIRKTRRMAAKIVNAYPRSDGARVLREVLAKMSE